MIQSSIIYFFVTVAITLGITYWASRKSTSKAALYTASSSISGNQNGLAIAGDYMSAGTILGIVGLYFMVGVDVSLYFIAPMAGLCIGLALIVGPLRRFGQFTLGDVLEARLNDSRMRIILGVCAITISLIYLVAQMVGAGGLISIVFGLSFETAVILVGILMTIYVAFGGMLAATWVQIIKAVFLVASVILLSVLCIVKAGSFSNLYSMTAAATAESQSLFNYGNLNLTLYSSASLTLGLMLGMMAMPHLLIRFFTVPDEASAKRSLIVASTLISLTMCLVFFIISPAGVSMIAHNPEYQDASGAILGGTNMITLHLARSLGGDLFFGVMSAIAFSTILAVVSGLTISISTASAHDIVRALSKADLTEKTELLVFRSAAILTSLAAIGLSILFKHENLTFLIVMGSSVAASTTFPLLAMAIYWRGLTPAGAMASGIVGLVSSVGLIILSPAFWVKVAGFDEAIFSSNYPALISVPLAFGTAWLVSSFTQPNNAPIKA